MYKEELQKQLFALADEKYRDFHSALMPTVEKSAVMGVRTPVLRKFANEFSKTEEAELFLNDLPHKYYEENNLHAFLIEKIKNYDELIKRLDEFLPFVDNWATCDMMRPKILKNNKERLLEDVRRWAKSPYVYEVRYAINCLMTYFLDEDFDEEFYNIVIDVEKEDYYIFMVKAWYFATALAKQYSSAVKVLEERKLDKKTHNKTIQKAVESYRLSSEEKAYLKTLKC
jgi:3-methyladenine DNA glycosylase AlkD